jgi:hypothetical protein
MAKDNGFVNRVPWKDEDDRDMASNGIDDNNVTSSATTEERLVITIIVVIILLNARGGANMEQMASLFVVVRLVRIFCLFVSSYLFCRSGALALVRNLNMEIHPMQRHRPTLASCSHSWRTNSQ